MTSKYDKEKNTIETDLNKTAEKIQDNKIVQNVSRCITQKNKNLSKE